MDQDKGYQQEKKKKVSFGQRLSNAQPTKTILFWSCVACIVLTMIIGFARGGWMTESAAQKMAGKMVTEAVVKRLAPLCVMQFHQDPEKDQKLAELKTASTWQRGSYVEKQGWATMSGEEKADQGVASECAALLMQITLTTPPPATESTSLLQ